MHFEGLRFLRWLMWCQALWPIKSNTVFFRGKPSTSQRRELNQYYYEEVRSGMFSHTYSCCFPCGRLRKRQHLEQNPRTSFCRDYFRELLPAEAAFGSQPSSLLNCEVPLPVPAAWCANVPDTRPSHAKKTGRRVLQMQLWAGYFREPGVARNQSFHLQADPWLQCFEIWRNWSYKYSVFEALLCFWLNNILLFLYKTIKSLSPFLSPSSPPTLLFFSFFPLSSFPHPPSLFISKKNT